MAEIRRKFKSLEEVKKYIYGMKEECYWSLSALANILEKDMVYVLFSEAVDIYEKYGYPEVFEHAADVIEWASRKVMREEPYILTHSGLGLAYILRRLAEKLRQKPNNLDLEEVNRKSEELLDLSDKVGRFDKSLRKYFIEDPETGYMLLRRTREVLRFLADAVAHSFALLLKTNDSEALSAMYEMINREYRIGASFKHWLGHILNGDIQVRLRYIHKRLHDMIHQILILNNGMDEFFFLLKKKGFLRRTSA